MAIRFKCHQCKKPLAVKDHLAGRKAICPGCRKPIVIPKPKPSSAEVEEQAAKFLDDSPEKAAAQTQAAVKSIKFTCEYCDEAVEAPFSEAGTKMPCPECKHIIRVPDVKQDKPKDWRDIQKKGPSAALINQVEQLDNAWGTEQKSRVSGSALMEAGAVADPQGQSFTLSIWLKRGMWSLLLVGLISAVFTGLYNARKVKRNDDALKEALELIKPNGKEAAQIKLSGEWAAEVHRAAGEICCIKNDPKPLEAQKHFRAAFALLRDSPKSVEKDLLLIDLALAQIELGGSDDEVMSKKRLAWADVQKEVSLTLEQTSAESRKLAMRLIGSRFAERNQIQLAAGMAGATREQYVGLILAQRAASDRSSKDQDKQPSQAEKKTLDDIEKQAEKLLPAPKPDGKNIDPGARIAHVEGLARQRRFKEALDLATERRDKSQDEALHCMEACIGGAELALADRTAPNNVAEAAAFVNKAMELFKEASDKELENHPWSIFQLTIAGISCDVAPTPELSKLLQAEFLPRVQLAGFRQKLAKSSTFMTEVSDMGSDPEQRELLSYALAWEALARQNARMNRSQSDIMLLGKDADERLRPLLLVGFALGQHESR